MRSDPREEICEPGLQIEVIQFFRDDDQAVHHRRPLAAAIRAAEQPRLPAQRTPPLGCVALVAILKLLLT